MNMFIETSDLNRLQSVFSCDSAEKLPDAVFDVGRDDRNSVFGTEDEVEVQRCVCVCHEFSNSFPAG